ncbi:ATP synthase F1 subunit delta [Leptospira ognonensis]|uniref:ATP synthase subunit delta n=1 Tax=Leptospira ognonensis TaxID=2484945 RepID=A0A4R9K531_9LEPT|nr:ATP synthase F1 subunit delta [Leptospira ognonensis]TGL61282.1 ATP synthase F1 subunit delta [Leptospira ognonensis]
MSLSKVPKVYATALLELAVDANSVEATEEELTQIVSALSADESIRHYFLSPVVDPIEKEKAAFKALSGKTSEIVTNFISLVVRKSRYQFLPDIVEEFCAGVDKLKNRSSLRIISKDLLTPEQKDKIIKSLTANFKRDFRVHESIDAHLLGGFRLFVDDYLIDASIRYKLDGMEEALLQKKIPVGAMYEN